MAAAPISPFPLVVLGATQGYRILDAYQLARTVFCESAAIERIVAGIEKRNRVLSKEERRRVACHEMGHAFVASTLPRVDPILKVSIIPRGVGALGYTIQRPTEDRFLLAESDLQNRVAVLIGGRAVTRCDQEPAALQPVRGIGPSALDGCTDVRV